MLNNPVKTTVVDGDTFLQRDLTDYLNATIDKDAKGSMLVLKEYFMRPHPDINTLRKYFTKAADEFGVPVSLLMVVGQIENNWTQVGPTIDQGWGIMHLVQNSYCNTLGEAAGLLGISEQTLKDNAYQNIRGAAALIASYAGEEKTKLTKLEDWFPALAKLSGLISPELRNMQARNYLETLKEGVKARTVWGEEIIISPKKNEINSYNYDKYKPLYEIRSSDYGPAISNLTPCNFATDRVHEIDTWVNHWIGTGTYLGAISWFHDCSSEVSAHFVIKNDGEITQVVLVANTAWHCGAVGQPYNNSRSIGVEHEATAANPGMWNSAPMLNASATMSRYFRNKYGFPTTQTSPGICGHNDMPGTSTDCPGPLPWALWMAYFNATIIPPSNNNCTEAAILTSDTMCSDTPGTVLNATASGLVKPDCDGFGNPNMFDVWYKFTAVDSSHTVHVEPATTLGDPVVSLYNSCNGTSIACSDAGAEGDAENLLLTGLIPDNTYYIRVYDYGIIEPAGGDANFNICVTHTPLSAFKLSGTITYNLSDDLLNDINVVIKSSGTIVDSSTSDSSGYYSIANLSAGSYSMEVNTSKPSGGINSTDALLALRHAGSLISLAGLSLSAADVDNNGIVNNTDGHLILRRSNRLDTTFTKGAWVFDNPQSISVTDSNLSFDFNGLAVGDINNSYILSLETTDPGYNTLNTSGSIKHKTLDKISITPKTNYNVTGKNLYSSNHNNAEETLSSSNHNNAEETLSSSVHSNEALPLPRSNPPALTLGSVITSDDSVTVPLVVNDFTNIGAVTLSIRYNPGVLSFAGGLNLTSSEILINSPEAGLVYIDFARIAPLNITSGKLLDLKFITNGGSSSLAFVTTQCEIADSAGNVVMANYNNGSILTGSEDYDRPPASYSLSNNYPNPFNPSTIINYSVPKAGKVTITIYDLLGNSILTLLNEEKPAGNYHVIFNAVNLVSGVYFYRMQAGSFVETKKLIFLK